MKYFLVAVFSLAVAAGQAQKAPVKKTAPAKPVAASNPIKTFNDSVSYAIGLNVANFYSQQGLKGLNTAVLTKAINDVYAKKKPLMSDAQCNDVVMKAMGEAQAATEKAQMAQVQPNIKKGEDFLTQNKSNPKIKTTASGLQYEVITEGTGPKPLATDTVTVNYKGTLIDGTEFDNSYSRGEPVSFPLNQVIAGWTEGVQLMPQGSKYKFYIPYQLGYGARTQGPIPGGSVLVFEVELLKVNGK